MGRFSIELEELWFSFTSSGSDDVSPHAEKMIRNKESIATIILMVRSEVVLEIVCREALMEIIASG